MPTTNLRGCWAPQQELLRAQASDTAPGQSWHRSLEKRLPSDPALTRCHACGMPEDPSPGSSLPERKHPPLAPTRAGAEPWPPSAPAEAPPASCSWHCPFCFRDPETLAESAQVTSTGWCPGGMAALGPGSQYNCRPPSSLPKSTVPKPGPPLYPREASGGTAVQGDGCNLGARARRGASPPPPSHLIHTPHFSPHMGAWQGLPECRGPTTPHFLWCSVSGGFRHPHPTCAPGAMEKALPLGPQCSSSPWHTCQLHPALHTAPLSTPAPGEQWETCANIAAQKPGSKHTPPGSPCHLQAMPPATWHERQKHMEPDSRVLREIAF